MSGMDTTDDLLAGIGGSTGGNGSGTSATPATYNVPEGATARISFVTHDPLKYKKQRLQQLTQTIFNRLWHNEQNNRELMKAVGITVPTTEQVAIAETQVLAATRALKAMSSQGRRYSKRKTYKAVKRYVRNRSASTKFKRLGRAMSNLGKKSYGRKRKGSRK